MEQSQNEANKNSSHSYYLHTLIYKEWFGQIDYINWMITLSVITFSNSIRCLFFNWSQTSSSVKLYFLVTIRRTARLTCRFFVPLNASKNKKKLGKKHESDWHQFCDAWQTNFPFRQFFFCFCFCFWNSFSLLTWTLAG